MEIKETKEGETTQTSKEEEVFQAKATKDKCIQLHNQKYRILIALHYHPDSTYDKISKLTDLSIQHVRTYSMQYQRKEILKIERQNIENTTKILSLTEQGKEEAKKILDFLNSKKDLIRELETKKYIHDSWQGNLKEYLDLNHMRGQLLECKRLRKSLSIDHYDMAKWNPEVGDFALDKPKEFFIVCRGIIKNLHDFNPYVKIHNITHTIKVPLSRISQKHLDKFHSFEGIIKFYSDNTPYIECVQWGCNLCGFKWWEKIQGNNIISPKKCHNPTCRGMNCFYVHDEERHDRHYLLLEESQNTTDSGKQPGNILCYVERELAGDDVVSKIHAGRKVKVNGIVKKKPVYKMSKLTNEFRLVVKVSDVEILEGDMDNFDLSEEEDETCRLIFKKMLESFDEGFKLLSKNFHPYLIGIDVIKEAIMLQMVCGSDNVNAGGIRKRNKFHILLVGDPGTGKSEIARYTCDLMPNSRFAVGTSSSGIGITASIRKEQELGVNVVEAGKVVMANGSICVIDEFDKLEKEDKNRLLECMESSTVTIDKAGLSRSMRAETCILALANPVSGDFTSPKDMLNEINLPPAVRQRFDLIFIMKEFTDEKMDGKVVDVMVDTGKVLFDEGFSNDLLKKYLWGVKNLPEPTMGDDAFLSLKKVFLMLRKAARGKYGDSSTAVGKRIVNTYQRLGKCYAKFRGSKVVEKVDILRAHKLVRSAFLWALPDGGDGNMDLDTSALYSDESKGEIDKRQEMRRLLHEVVDRVKGKVSGNVLTEVFLKAGFKESEMWNLINHEKSGGSVIEVEPDMFVVQK